MLNIYCKFHAQYFMQYSKKKDIYNFIVFTLLKYSYTISQFKGNIKKAYLITVVEYYNIF